MRTNLQTPWKAYLQTFFKDKLSNIPLYNTNQNDKNILKNGFSIDMFNRWAKLKYREPKIIHEIIQQPLWNNSLIKIDGKEANYETWKKAGISHINDLIDNNGEIAKLEFLIRKFRFNCKQMEYNSIIHSIPNTWKKEVKKGQT